MATLTYFKSVGDDGGTIGDQLTDGGIDDLLPPITSQDRLNGVNFYRKLWVRSDEDISVMNSLANRGEYNACWFVSAGENDTVADLTGNEVKYGALMVVSNTVNSAVVTNNTTWEIVRDNDYAHIGNDVVQIDTVTDNGDGTLTLNFSPDIADSDWSGTYMSTCIDTSMSAGDDNPFWIQVDVPALSPMNNSFSTLEFLMVY